MTEKQPGIMDMVLAIRGLLDKHSEVLAEMAENEMNAAIKPYNLKVTLPRFPEAVDEDPPYFVSTREGQDLNVSDMEVITLEEAPEEVQKAYEEVCKKYNYGEIGRYDDVQSAVKFLLNAEDNGPRPPTDAEMKQLIEATQSEYRLDRETAEHQLTGAYIAVYPNYITGGPGYCGKAISVIYDGSPSFFDVFTEEYDMSQKPWPKTGRLKRQGRE